MSRPLVAPLVISLAAAVACTAPVALTQQVEARRLASELQVRFVQAAEAANRAIMADTDETSAAAAREANEHATALTQTMRELRPLLESLRYSTEVGRLDTFAACFAEYRKLDEEILPLAVENTNLKAQRLSFGPAREAADAFRAALEAAARTARAADGPRADALAARAEGSVLEILALQAPHIAESEDTAMTRMEQQMAAAEAVARRNIDQLRSLLPQAAQLGAAATALDQFMKVNAEMVTLSRRNSEVRSLALTLGRKRMVTAQCQDQLRALQDSLAKHALTATR